MMKAAMAVVSIIILVAVLSCGKPPRNGEWERYGLKGRVRQASSVTTLIIFENGKMTKIPFSADTGLFDERGRLTRFSRFDSNGNPALRIDYQHDERGLKIAENSTGPQERPLGSKTYRYDESGRVTAETDFDPDGTTNQTRFFSYRADGTNLTEEKYADGSARTEHRYDGAGNRTETAEYRADGTIQRRIVRNFSTNNQLMQTVWQDGRDRMLFRETMIYSAPGRLVERREFSPDGKLTAVRQFQYDENGHLAGEQLFTAEGVTLEKKELVHDAKGNLVTLTELGADGRTLRKTGINYDTTGNPADRTVTEYVYRNGRETGYRAKNTVTRYEYFPAR